LSLHDPSLPLEGLRAVGLVVLSLGLLLLVAGLVWMHRRRHVEILEEDLQDLANSRRLNRLEGRLPARLEELARALGGRGRRAGLGEILWGQDRSGSWYLCRREVDGHRQQAVLFENKFLTVRDLAIMPRRGAARRKWNPFRRRGKTTAAPLELHLVWRSPADAVDERSVRMVQAIYLLMAQARNVVEPFGLHLQVHDQKVAIHTRRPLDGDALRVFLDVALELRRQLGEVPRVSGALRLSPGQSGAVLPSGEGTVTRALKVVGHPNDHSGPKVPYGAMTTREAHPAPGPSSASGRVHRATPTAT